MGIWAWRPNTCRVLVVVPVFTRQISSYALCPVPDLIQTRNIAPGRRGAIRLSEGCYPGRNDRQLALLKIQGQARSTGN